MFGATALLVGFSVFHAQPVPFENRFMLPATDAAYIRFLAERQRERKTQASRLSILGSSVRYFGSARQYFSCAPRWEPDTFTAGQR